YGKVASGEKSIALGIAEQIDARKNLQDELDSELAIAKQLTAEYDAQQSRLASMVSSTDVGKSLQRMQDEALAEGALMAGKIDQSTYDQIIGNLRDVKEEGDETFRSLQESIDGWGKASADAFVEFAFTGKTSFGDMTTSILKDIAKMMVYQSVTKPAASWLGSIMGGMFGGVTENAKGNVFTSPSLHAYANTIQTTPKFFEFAKGGVFAEAGPEAVMPLARDGNGRLGVRAQGGSAPNVNITVNNSMADQAGVSVQPRMNNGQLEVEVIVQRVLAQDMRRNGPITQGLSSTFGLARSV
ncbi:MAG: hypothetical protein KAX66_09050, partial [Propionivibrio sp.]|nr:hypothetical protein [Propionivibrio sp.]